MAQQQSAAYTDNSKFSEEDEFIKCKNDPVYFIKNHVWVVHPIRGRVRFTLYKFQERIVREIHEHRFNIIRKFRQAGVTTIMCAYGLWLTTFQTDKTVMVVSIGDRESTNVLERIKDMHRELPEYLKAEVIETNKHNFKLETGSKIRSQPAGAGRSESVSLLIVDEAAFIDDLPEFWKAVFPTLSTGGRAVVLSTVNGMSNLYYELYRDAQAGKNEFNIIDIHWKEHPDYNNPKWEKTTRQMVGQRGWKQEYECEFLGTGETFIDSEILANIYSSVAPPLEKRYNFRLHVWSDPIPGHDYLLSFDPAFGVQRDNSAFHIIDLYTGEQVAEFYSNKIKAEDFGTIIYNEAKSYNNCIVAGERNTLGLIILQKLFDRHEYENMYFGEDGELGLQIGGTKARDKLLEALQDNLYLSKVRVLSRRTVDELVTFIIDDNDKIIADDGYTDDLVMALALGCYVRNELVLNGLVTPSLEKSMTNDYQFNPLATSKYNDNKEMDEYKKWILS